MITGITAVRQCGMLENHSTVFTNVASTSDAVIGCRALNPLSETLLREGHASKGFYIKAKSCDWGPMAGMVLVNPAFSKAANLEKQQHAVDDALQKGAGRADVFLSSARLAELTDLGLISQEKPDGVRSAEILINASSPRGGGARFVAVRDGNQEPLWQLFDVTSGARVPVQGLTNKSVPQAGPQPVGPRAVVAGDYDLFCVWGRHENQRPLNCPPRPLFGNSPFAKAYVKAVRGTGAEREHMGNVSGYVEIIIRRLNAGIIARAGYTGGNMVHHNDESGNPFTPGEDFPVLFFIPGQMPKSASNSHELMSIYEECTRLSYVVERNSGFCLKKPQINAPATTFRT